MPLAHCPGRGWGFALGIGPSLPRRGHYRLRNAWLGFGCSTWRATVAAFQPAGAGGAAFRGPPVAHCSDSDGGFSPLVRRGPPLTFSDRRSVGSTGLGALVPPAKPRWGAASSFPNPAPLLLKPEPAAYTTQYLGTLAAATRLLSSPSSTDPPKRSITTGSTAVFERARLWRACVRSRIWGSSSGSSQLLRKRLARSEMFAGQMSYLLQ